MALGALLEASEAEQKVAWRPLGAVLERLRSPQDGLREIDGRLGGGWPGEFGWPWPWGAPLSKNIN